MKKEKTGKGKGIIKRIGVWVAWLIPSDTVLGGVLYNAATHEFGKGVFSLLSAIGLTEDI